MTADPGTKDMVWRVTDTFVDWDGFTIWKGTIADELVARGWGHGGKQFYNLIANGSVLAVLKRRPPVELIERNNGNTEDAA